MWDSIKDFFGYAIIDWNSEAIPATETTPLILSEDIFTLTILNCLGFVLIYFAAKIFIKYIKRFFKARQLTDKQLTIEGKEIAIWKLARQLIQFTAAYFCYLSLKVNNPNLDLANILGYEFFRFEDFHIAVYHLFIVVAVIFIARITVNFVKVFLLKTVGKRDSIDTGTQYIYVQLAKYLVYSIAFIVLLRSFGMNLDLFLTATTFLLVGVGLGLQAIFQDYFSGLLLLFEGTVKVGDVLEIEAINSNENFVARVVQINLRTSKVETRDEKVLVIPNSKLTQQSVINWSFGSPVTRFGIPITLRYGVDLELVKNILVGCAERHPDVLKTREPFVRLMHFGNNGLEMDLIFWAEQSLNIETLKSEIRFDMDAQLRKHNITVPFPQTDVHINPEIPPVKSDVDYSAGASF